MALNKSNKYLLEVYSESHGQWLCAGTRKHREKAEQEGAALIRKYKTYTAYRIVERGTDTILTISRGGYAE